MPKSITVMLMEHRLEVQMFQAAAQNPESSVWTHARPKSLALSRLSRYAMRWYRQAGIAGASTQMVRVSSCLQMGCLKGTRAAIRPSWLGYRYLP